MEYKTQIEGHQILIKPKEEVGYVAWQCINDEPVVGWGGYANATQALKAIKDFFGRRASED